MDKDKQLSRIREQMEVVVGKINDPNLCKGSMEVQTRVSGYYRSLSAMNTGKQSEVSERAEYII